MANTLAGTTVAISTTAQADNLTITEFEALSYTPIGQIGALGQSGRQENILNYDTMDTTVTQKAKGIIDAGSMTLEVARSYNDAGQIALRAAAATNFNYVIKITRNDAPSASFTDRIEYNRGLISGPTRPNGRVEDFDVEVFTCAFQQVEVVDEVATV